MKNSIRTLLFTTFLFAPMVLAQLPNPVGHWTFDEGSGDTTADVSGNGNNGQIWSDGVSWSDDTPSGTGHSLEFRDMLGGVYIGDPEILQIVGDITLAAWIKTGAATGSWHNIIAKGHGVGENVIRVDGNSHPTQIWCGSYDNADHMVFSWDLSDELDRWTHVVGTYSTDNALWSLYLDGVLASEAEDVTGAVTVDRGWAIGARAPDSTGVFPTERNYEGLIDDARIYNVALTDVQVAELYNQNATAVEDKSNAIPGNFGLSQNYPNPFNPSTTINFSLKEGSNIKLFVYDVTGRLVDIIVNNEFKPAGTYEVKYNAEKLASGIYFLRMNAGNFNSSIKMILLK